ncbi:hybrid sensor histidine kinase/response regulator [Massilia aquatica]|uniref:histidine kinase n=1 Tax=Massilia aquatica TaxID=2609000 RepID=A0ABX0MI33_9BURK|nr:ATP-binding protein [Massilia aquatica]NHZ43922.1 PAS domain-containing protein [Massilia aquatica]
MHAPPDHFLLFRSSPYPYLVMAPDLTIIDANDAYLRSVRRTKEQIVGLYVFDAFPENPDDAGSTNIAEVKASLETAMATKRPHTTPFLRYSVPVETETGTVFQERFWNAVHTPALRDDGSVAFVYQNAIDVTDLYRFDRRTQSAAVALGGSAIARTDEFNRAQMHEAMMRVVKDERGHLRNLFNQAPGFVAVLTGADHVFEMANESYYQLVGHRELIGKPVWQALPEVRGQGFEERLAQVYTTGEAWKTYGMRLNVQREANGPTEERFIDLSYQAYRAEDGSILGIFAQGYDVTEAHDAREAERESTDRLNEGLLAAKMVVWDWDMATDELYLSENASQVLGLQSNSRGFVDSHVHPQDRSTLDEARARALAQQSRFEVTVRFVRPDNGALIWIDVRGRVRCDTAGAAYAVRGIAIDISERVHAEEELRKADRRKDEFLAMLAHELRNPLAPISTAAEVLRFAGTNPERVRATSEIILRQVKHMTNLIDDLLDVSRVTRGLIELDEECLDVESIVQAAVEQARPLLDARGHVLSLHFSSVKATVSGDRTRLVQTLSNLLNNAAKYTPQGGRIALTVEVDAGKVRISVQDNGIGIEPALLPHLFDLFTQGRRTSDRAQGGLGLGLALVRSLLTMHGGTIETRSEGTDMGSIFVITLPCMAQLAPPHLADAEPAPAPVAPLRIMVVDDNRDAGQSLATLLHACGHAVLVAADGREALALAASSQFDAFILDIGLPGMNGYELARHIRSEPAHAQAILIALTGYSQAHDRVLSKGAGFAHHLVKPVVLAELEQALRGAVR